MIKKVDIDPDKRYSLFFMSSDSYFGTKIKFVGYYSNIKEAIDYIESNDKYTHTVGEVFDNIEMKFVYEFRKRAWM